MHHLVGAYGGGGVVGTPYRSKVTSCNLLTVCLLLPLLQLLLSVAELVEGAGGISMAQASSKDGLSLMASS